MVSVDKYVETVDKSNGCVAVEKPLGGIFWLKKAAKLLPFVGIFCEFIINKTELKDRIR